MSKEDRIPVDLGDDAVYLVNPKGAIHIVTKEHARERLRDPGWHVATKGEIDVYEKADGLQTLEKPAGKPAVAGKTDLPEAKPALPGDAPMTPNVTAHVKPEPAPKHKKG